MNKRRFVMVVLPILLLASQSSLYSAASARPRLSYIDNGLFIAAQHNNAGQVRDLVAKGANISALNDQQRTPMHTAASFGGVEAMIALKEHGADVNARDLAGNTPLHKAAEFGHEYAVRYLAQNGADKSAINKFGQTPADLAREKNRPGVALFLSE